MRISWDSSPESLILPEAEDVAVNTDADETGTSEDIGDPEGVELVVGSSSSPEQSFSPSSSLSSPSSLPTVEVGDVADAEEEAVVSDEVEVAAELDCATEVLVLFPSPVTLASTPAACIRAMTSA